MAKIQQCETSNKSYRTRLFPLVLLVMLYKMAAIKSYTGTIKIKQPNRTFLDVVFLLRWTKLKMVVFSEPVNETYQCCTFKAFSIFVVWFFYEEKGWLPFHMIAAQKTPVIDTFQPPSLNNQFLASRYETDPLIAQAGCRITGWESCRKVVTQGIAIRLDSTL